MPKEYQPNPDNAITSKPRSVFIPPKFHDQEITDVHQYPLVLDQHKNPRGRRPAHVACDLFSRVELQPPNSYVALVFDVDEPNPNGWHGKPRITPTWIVQSTTTGRCHVGYAIDPPVHRNPKSLPGPLYKLANVADSLTHFLGGDPGYGGSITRNPLIDDPDLAVHWHQFEPFTLGQGVPICELFGGRFGSNESAAAGGC